MLFIRECKKVLFSLTFWLYFIAVLAMFFTQFYPDCRYAVTAPVPGQENYGMTAKEIPETLMPAAAESLVSEYLSGSFKAYPLGFYKEVRLNAKKKEKMAEIITEISGISKEQLDSFTDFQEGGYFMTEDGSFSYMEPTLPEIHIPDSLTYEHFRELMREADELIGGGSKYADESIVNNFSLVPKTYEDALEEYEEFVNDDKFTIAYARLYCDYLGIVIAILPVFAAVSISGLDKKSRMEQLFYARKVSSARLVFTRYAALIMTMSLPIMITAGIAQSKVIGLYSGADLDQFAIFQYAAIWLLPSLMTASAVGMLVTEGCSGLLAIFIQGAWWFASTFASAAGLTGSFGKLTLVLRHNSLSERGLFHYETFIFNRAFFAGISILAVALTALIYAKKRRGRCHVFQIRIPDSWHKSEA
ncbi:MAG: ABC transporter permease [Eubacteriales bacterium]|nr:ABC transporter permease [Eubacteriales bacterium]